MTHQELYQYYQEFPNITTSTKEIKKGDIFFALKGEKFDANLFAEEALQKGCSYAVVDNPGICKSEKYLLVSDVLPALQGIAKIHRNQLSIPVIGITGTNGKTTTKELLREVLSKKFKTIATIGNLNNHIGVPLTLLNLKKEHEIAIIEMGANHVGEIGELCEIAQPTHGLITSIGKAHLEGFGGMDGIIKTKTDLYRSVHKNNGILFVNADNDLLMQQSSNFQRITYGFDNGNIKGNIINQSPFIELSFNSVNIKSHLYGQYNADNILAAACIGSYFGVSDHLIKEALEQYIPGNNRSQIKKTNHNTLFLDAYNANPTSMKAAIESFAAMELPCKYLILGEMLELGNFSDNEHKAIIDLLKKLELDDYCLVGKNFLPYKSDKHLVFADIIEASEYFKKYSLKGHYILIKGSRGVKLEQLEEVL